MGCRNNKLDELTGLNSGFDVPAIKKQLIHPGRKIRVFPPSTIITQNCGVQEDTGGYEGS